MRRGCLLGAAILLLVLPVASTPASGSHGQNTLPSTIEDPRIDRAVEWFETNAKEEGCVAHPKKGECTAGGNAWAAMGLSAAGVDLTEWPTPDDSLRGWLVDNAEDLWDTQYKRNCDSPEEGGNCRALAAMSLSKSILALRSTGLDPSGIPLPDGDERDFVAELLDTFEGGQFGGQSYINDDIWAVIALNSVEYSREEIHEAADYITKHQGPAGGVGYGADQATASPDTTGAALMALAPRGYPSFQDRALDYLGTFQVEDGEYRGCWPSPGGEEADSESTAWASLGIVAAGEDLVNWSVGGQSPTGCLFNFQCGEGGFKTAAGDNYVCESFYGTVQGLAGASWVPFGQLKAPNSQAQRNSSADVNETVALAQASGELVRIGNETHDPYEFTPDEEGPLTFHGLDRDPHPRNLTFAVDVQPEEQDSDDGQNPAPDGDGSEDDGGSVGSDDTTSGPDDTDGGQDDSQAPNDDDGGADDQSPEDSPQPPSVIGWSLPTSERNVSHELRVDADAGDAPVAAYRVDWGDESATSWRANATFEHTYTSLGTVTVTAWARDAEDRVSDPAEAQLEVVDATPRIDVDGPATVHRGEPAPFSATAGDPDGPAPAIEWTAAGTNATGENATFRFDEPGVRTVDARAVDAAGNVANASHQLVVENRAPENVTVEPTVVPANQTTLLVADAIDPEGDELDIRWTRDAGLLPGPRFAYEAPAPGNDTLVLTVVDEHGDRTQAEVSLRIVPHDASKAAGSPTNAANEGPGSGSNASIPKVPPTPANVSEPNLGWPDNQTSGAGSPSCQSTRTGPGTPPSRGGQAPSAGCQASTVPIDSLDASSWDRDGEAETEPSRGSNAWETARSVPALEAAVVVSVATLAGLGVPRRFR